MVNFLWGIGGMFKLDFMKLKRIEKEIRLGK